MSGGLLRSPGREWLIYRSVAFFLCNNTERSVNYSLLEPNESPKLSSNFQPFAQEHRIHCVHLRNEIVEHTNTQEEHEIHENPSAVYNLQIIRNMSKVIVLAIRTEDARYNMIPEIST